MPAKKETLTDAERARRIRETARGSRTSNDSADFERVFAAVAKGVHNPNDHETTKKRQN